MVCLGEVRARFDGLVMEHGLTKRVQPGAGERDVFDDPHRVLPHTQTTTDIVPEGRRKASCHGVNTAPANRNDNRLKTSDSPPSYHPTRSSSKSRRNPSTSPRELAD